jgi:hypothetical protein
VLLKTRALREFIKNRKADRVRKRADSFIRSPEVEKPLLETEYMAAILISVKNHQKI